MWTRDALARLTIDEVLERWPQTADVFQKLRLACIGCAIQPFCTVTEAAELHRMPPAKLVEMLAAVIGDGIENEASA